MFSDVKHQKVAIRVPTKEEKQRELDKIKDTAYSHERCSVVEVMGRNAGYLALHSAIATGANDVIVPEIERSYEDVLAKMKAAMDAGKNHFIIIANRNHCR